MQLHLTTDPLPDVAADAIAVLAPTGATDLLADLSQRLEIDLVAALGTMHHEGKLGEVTTIPTGGRIAAPLLLVVGLGPADEVDDVAWRRAAAAAVRHAPKDSRLAIGVPALGATRVQAAAEGALLGGYAYTTYRRKNPDRPSVEEVLLVTDGDGAADAVERATAVAGAVNLARDLVNTPPADKRPPVLAERMADAARAAGVEVEVLDEDALAEGGFGGILGVGRGSSEPPRLVRMTYRPQGESRGHVALVGKGITFDSGGLSLKPWKSMLTMKSDMAGAAAVAATMTALAALGVDCTVTGLAALAENMPSGTATRPSDVLTHRGGTTVEVLNTDAEGRLVLADAIAYAAEQEPDAIIDLATLTGAQVVALGDDVAAVMGNDEALVKALEQAARRAGEQIWPLPLVDRYAEHLKSEVADLANIGSKSGHAGTITAGLFLRHFAGERSWAHLDIAGPAFSEDGDDFYRHKGATGFGVRTLLSYLTA